MNEEGNQVFRFLQPSWNLICGRQNSSVLNLIPNYMKIAESLHPRRLRVSEIL